VGTIRRDGIIFQIYPKDHFPIHAHVQLDRGQVIVAFEQREVRVIKRLGNVREADESKVLAVAREVYDAVVGEWRRMQG
jgi:Domain of unknown function (DUF4160)